jgi:hypothetical protein
MKTCQMRLLCIIQSCPRRFWNAAATLLCVSITMCPLLCSPGFPLTHEGERYPALLGHFHESLRCGLAYPRWMPELAGGYGYPTFVFYQPFIFYLSSFFRSIFGCSLGFSFFAAATLLLSCSCFAWAWMARKIAPSSSVWLAPILFAFTPNLFLNLYVRGDLSEFTATNVGVLALCAALLLHDRASQHKSITFPTLGLAAALAGIVYAHPMTGATCWAAIACLMFASLFALPATSQSVFGISTLLAFTAGIALSLPYWLPFLQLKSEAMLDAATGDYYDPLLHLVMPWQFISRFWGYGGSAPGTGDTMSFQLGLPHLAMAALGAFLSRRRPLFVGAAVVYAGLIAAMMPWAAPLWTAPSPLRYFQFPWRLMSITAIFQPLLALGIPATFNRGDWPSHRLAPIGLCFALSAWYAPLFITQVPGDPISFHKLEDVLLARQRSCRERFECYALRNEFLPRNVVVPPNAPRGIRPMIECESGGTVIADENCSCHKVSATVELENPCDVTINQFLFPGWHVEVDGEAVPYGDLEKSKRRDGLICLPIESEGKHCIIAYYAGPPGGNVRMTLVASAIAMVIASTYLLDRRILRPLAATTGTSDNSTGVNGGFEEQRGPCAARHC